MKGSVSAKTLKGALNSPQSVSGKAIPRGNDGISPTVDIFDTEDGHRVVITDIAGPKIFDVMNGTKGADGHTPIKGVDYFDGEDGEDGKMGVYIGEGEMPDGYNVQIIPNEDGESIEGIKGDPGKDGVSVTHSWNGTTLVVTSASGTSSADLKGDSGYTPQKGVDYFDGKDGKDGKDGEDGKDGYTPVKGVDYFDGEDGKDGSNGKDGYTPVKGVDYFDGENGKDGTNGKDGKDGYTPVKGVDYFDGEDGTNGANGADGYSVWYATVEPTTTPDEEYEYLLTVIVSYRDVVSGDLIVSPQGKLWECGEIYGEAGSTYVRVYYLCSLKGADGERGEDGHRGTGILHVSSSTTSASGTGDGGETIKYKMSLSTVKNEAGVDVVLVGDIIFRSVYTYPVVKVDTSYVYMSAYTSIKGNTGSKGADGTSVTVSSVTESVEDGGNNVVTFSDGKTLTVKNGRKGDKGDTGPAYTLTDADKASIVSAVKASLTTETWTFELESGTTVTKAVYVGG